MDRQRVHACAGKKKTCQQNSCKTISTTTSESNEVPSGLRPLKSNPHEKVCHPSHEPFSGLAARPFFAAPGTHLISQNAGLGQHKSNTSSTKWYYKGIPQIGCYDQTGTSKQLKQRRSNPKQVTSKLRNLTPSQRAFA